MAPVLAKRLGAKASFVVSNRTGAGGEIALGALARAAPDGYTIGTLTTPSFIVIPLVKKPQYDPAAILPLARVVDDPTLVVAGGASSLHDLKALVARAQAAPGSVAMGHNGVGTNGHLAALAIEVAAGAKLNDIPFGTGHGSSKSRTSRCAWRPTSTSSAMSVVGIRHGPRGGGRLKGLAQLAVVQRCGAAGGADGEGARSSTS